LASINLLIPRTSGLWRHRFPLRAVQRASVPLLIFPLATPSSSTKETSMMSLAGRQQPACFRWAHPPVASLAQLTPGHAPLIFNREACESAVWQREPELWARDLSNLFPRAITATVSSFERLGWGRRHQGICAIRTESALTCATTSLHLSMGGSWRKIGPMQDSGLPLHMYRTVLIQACSSTFPVVATDRQISSQPHNQHCI
jgi:hypothetical protein